MVKALVNDDDKSSIAANIYWEINWIKQYILSTYISQCVCTVNKQNHTLQNLKPTLKPNVFENPKNILKIFVNFN